LSGRLHIYSIVGLFLTSLVLISCDNTVDPFGDTSANYGLFGYLDADADTQFVRVEIRRESQTRIESEIPSMISREISSGMEQVWQDSLVTLSSGEEGLLFWSAFRPEESESYQLAGTWEQRLIVSETTAIPDRVTVRYVTSYGNGVLFVKDLDYFNRFLFFDENAWSVITRIERDLDDIRIEGGFGDNEQIRFREASVIIRLRSKEWLNGGSTNSNVENGFGFVGSVITFESPWTIDDKILTERNFRDEQ